jgi:hypothetical protein
MTLAAKHTPCHAIRHSPAKGLPTVGIIMMIRCVAQLRQTLTAVLLKSGCCSSCCSTPYGTSCATACTVGKLLPHGAELVCKFFTGHPSWPPTGIKAGGLGL